MRRFLGLIGVAALLATGCNSGDPASEPLTKTEYQQAINRMLGTFFAQTEQLFVDIVNEARPDCASKTEALHAMAEDIVDEAAELTPPADVAALHDEFVDQARISVEAVGDAADDAEDGTLTCGEAMRGVIYGLPSSERAEEALEGIQEKGYEIFGGNG